MDTNVYESDKLLNEYLLFHYGTEADIFGDGPGPREALDFPVRAVEELLDVKSVPGSARAFDIGCAVGRSSFELAWHATDVIGIDYSHSFIQAAQTMKTAGHIAGTKHEEGARYSSFEARAPDGINRGHVKFEQGDAINLREDLGAADIVLAANLICRLGEPLKFIERLPSLIRGGGQLLLTTPFTWLEEFTPKENWLGGTETESSFEALRSALEPDFALEHTADLPFVIREHSRKFQYGIALGSRWTRR